MPLPCYPSLFGWKYYRTHTGDVSSIHQRVILISQKSTVMNKSKHVLNYFVSFLSPSTTGFAPEQSETDFLKRRLKEERAKVAKAERARREAEARCLSAERERAVYRLLARRWQSRLNALLSQQQQQQDSDEQGESNAVHHQHRAAEDLLDLLDSGTGNNNNNNAALVARGGIIVYASRSRRPNLWTRVRVGR